MKNPKSDVFCPNCGAKNIVEQKFCRACGLNLEKSTESMLEQSPPAGAANLLKREAALEKFGNFAFGGFGLILLVGVAAIIYGIVTKMILTGASVLFGVLLIAFLIFAGLALIYVVFAEGLKEKKQKRNYAAAEQITEPRIVAEFPAEKTFEPASSVTENSTELLAVKNKTRKLQ